MAILVSSILWTLDLGVDGTAKQKNEEWLIISLKEVDCKGNLYWFT